MKHFRSIAIISLLFVLPVNAHATVIFNQSTLFATSTDNVVSSYGYFGSLSFGVPRSLITGNIIGEVAVLVDSPASGSNSITHIWGTAAQANAYDIINYGQDSLGNAPVCSFAVSSNSVTVSPVDSWAYMTLTSPRSISSCIGANYIIIKMTSSGSYTRAFLSQFYDSSLYALAYNPGMASGAGAPAMALSDSSGLFFTATSSNTRIDLVSPYDKQTGISSTSPFTLQAFGYIAQSYTGDLSGAQAVDNADKNGLQIKWTIQNAVNNLTATVCYGTGLECPLGFIDYYSGTGYAVLPTNNFAVSTTTTGNLSTGYYRLNTSIIKPSSFFGLTGLFGISFGQTVIVATSTTFSVGTVTAQQTELFNLTQASAGGVSIMTSTTTAVSLSSCNPFSLNLGLCLAVLFFPTQSDMTNLLQFAHDNFLNRAPWGYATRMVSILTNNATTTANTALPTWVVTFPSIQGATGSPLAGSSISFNMQNMLDTGSTTLNGIVDPISGKNMRQIIEPYILLFIAISALIIVFHDIMGMGKITNSKYADK